MFSQSSMIASVFSSLPSYGVWTFKTNSPVFSLLSRSSFVLCASMFCSSFCCCGAQDAINKSRSIVRVFIF